MSEWTKSETLRDVKNVANTGVVDWAGELYALWEGGRPHKMDPTTLRTLGEADAVLGQDLEVPQMAAHYRVLDTEDPADKRLAGYRDPTHTPLV